MKTTGVEKITYDLTRKKSNKAWKCYICDLTFKEESHAFVHTDISNHSTRQIELI